MQSYKVIAFDADDTLWVNEPYFREAEDLFTDLLTFYDTKNKIKQELYKTILTNLPLYGYGIKSCILSMIECANAISNQQVSAATLQAILNIGKNMLQKPVELLEGVEQCLQVLSDHYKLIVVTKGDLLDQEKKLIKSGLMPYFHHIEVVSEKNKEAYLKVIKHQDILPADFLMIGNSLKSDVLPVLEIGAKAIHIPYHTIWQHETVHQSEFENYSYETLPSIQELTNHLLNGF